MLTSNIVRIERFRSAELGNERTVYVYVPPGYDQDESSRFPVLYVQDGQHAFQADESGGSWDLHLIADRLISERKIRPIVIVAVAHIPESRMAEYMHSFPGSENALGIESRGERYEKFLIEEVKPYIDRNFRTLNGPENTAVMGSSAGGLVSYNLGFRRPDIFGMVGVLCPYFVVIDQNRRETWIGQFRKDKPPIRLWIDVGEAEGYTVLEKHVRSAVDTSLEAGFRQGDDLWYYYVPGSGHSQKDWTARAHAPLLYFFGEIGSPIRVELVGPDAVGLTGACPGFNPIVHYDSGFVATDLDGFYEVDDPSIAGVAGDGRIVPKQVGTTRVTYRKDGLASTREITVVPHLSADVGVTIYVAVPVDTPDVAYIYAGIPLPKIGDRLYGGTFQIPRTVAFQFRISWGYGLNEKDAHGREVPYRSFRPAEGLNLAYRVESW